MVKGISRASLSSVRVKPPVVIRKRCVPECASLANAALSGRAHIVRKNQGYHVHIGDRASMNLNVGSLNINNLTVSGNGVVNATDTVITMNGVDIPTDPELLLQAYQYVQHVKLVNALHDERVHIMQTSFGYHVHVGDRAGLNLNACAMRLNAVSISYTGNHSINGNDHTIAIGDVEIPTDPHALQEALEAIH